MWIAPEWLGGIPAIIIVIVFVIALILDKDRDE